MIATVARLPKEISKTLEPSLNYLESDLDLEIFENPGTVMTRRDKIVMGACISGLDLKRAIPVSDLGVLERVVQSPVRVPSCTKHIVDRTR